MVFQVFLTRSDTNRAVQPQKMIRGLKFWTYEEEDFFLMNVFFALKGSKLFIIICTIYVAKTMTHS